jgi:hypothetical protein
VSLANYRFVVGWDGAGLLHIVGVEKREQSSCCRASSSRDLARSYVRKRTVRRPWFGYGPLREMPLFLIRRPDFGDG